MDTLNMSTKTSVPMTKEEIQKEIDDEGYVHFVAEGCILGGTPLVFCTFNDFIFVVIARLVNDRWITQLVHISGVFSEKKDAASNLLRFEQLRAEANVEAFKKLRKMNGLD